MEHSFNTTIAKQYGIEEAVMLNHFVFWIQKNKANDVHFHDGHYWTYNTNKALSELFPYISESKMFRVLKHLEEEGLLIKGNYNKNKMDRTCWYALSEKAVSLMNFSFQNDEMQISKMKNGNSQNEVTIPDSITTDSNIKEIEDKSSIKERSWRDDFNVYLSLVQEAKEKLLEDNVFCEQMEKYYPRVDYDKTIEKMVELFWGTEAGWVHKKSKRTKQINMFTTLKKNFSNNFVFKERGQVGRIRIPQEGKEFNRGAENSQKWQF